MVPLWQLPVFFCIMSLSVKTRQTEYRVERLMDFCSHWQDVKAMRKSSVVCWLLVILMVALTGVPSGFAEENTAAGK